MNDPHRLAMANTHYCPGCTHGVAHRLVAEVIDELAIREKDNSGRLGWLFGFFLPLFQR